MLDVSAVFDTLDHDALLQCLHVTFDLSGTVLKWFQFYLTDHTQSVVVVGTTSLPALLKYMGPQGSILGPLLFTLYIEPLGSTIHYLGLQHHMYDKICINMRKV